MDLELNGKVALVTGASRGIGKYIAHALARAGCHVALCARGEETLTATADALRTQYGGDVYAEALDLTDAEAPARFVAAAADALGGVDVLVGNVGGNRRGAFADLTDDDWRALIDLNLMSHVRTARAAIPHMREAGSGAICFVSSIFGREVGGAGLTLYNTTKSALISMAKIMAQELTPEGIRVNTVAPGVHPLSGRELGSAHEGAAGEDGAVHRRQPAHWALRARGGGGRHGGVPVLGPCKPHHGRVPERRRRTVAVAHLATAGRRGALKAGGTGRGLCPHSSAFRTRPSAPGLRQVPHPSKRVSVASMRRAPGAALRHCTRMGLW